MSFSFSYEKIETFLSNVSFIALFCSMLGYWIETSGLISKSASLSFQNNQTNTNQISMLFVNGQGNETFSEVPSPETLETLPVVSTNSLLQKSQNPVSNHLNTFSINMPNQESSVVSFQTNLNSAWFFQKKFKVGPFALLVGNTSLLTLLSLRWIESGHFPLSNLYESLMFLSWALTFFHFLLEKMTSNTLPWLGSITSPTAFFTTAFANFSLPAEMQRSSALVPALQSNWLMMHVTVMILSYAALIFGSLLSIAFLILTYSISSEQLEKKVDTEQPMVALTVVRSKIQWAKNLDNLSYRMLGIAFPLLTIGILSGAVWANEAWGSYWSWDPKETWALLTWFVFAIYLHTRITKGWQGKKPALIASLGFFVVWICYLGVNLLGEGLHSYGWLQF